MLFKMYVEELGDLINCVLLTPISVSLFVLHDRGCHLLLPESKR
jgi:hypothetical protein